MRPSAGSGPGAPLRPAGRDGGPDSDPAEHAPGTGAAGHAPGSDPAGGGPDPAAVRREIARRLAGRPPSLPARFFYDERGARLFQEITTLPEYYPTATEIGILRDCMPDVAGHVGPGVRVAEYGSGSGVKTWILLDHLEAPAAYLPIDVARAQLMAFAERVSERYPHLDVLPIAADYTRLDALPWPRGEGGSTLAFFPGSTVGNFEPDDAVLFMRRIRGQILDVGEDRGEGRERRRAFLLIGVDRTKDKGVLLRAYDDPRGLTARFNRNMLLHLNRLLGAEFEADAFEHRAVWNADASRIEMHLVSTKPQTVALGPHPDAPRVSFAEGEAIVTEHSYKFAPGVFEAMARRAGYDEVASWTDEREWFAVHLLRAAP